MGDVFIADTDNLHVVEIQTVSANFGFINVCPNGQTTPAPCTQSATLLYNVSANATLLDPVVTTEGAQNLDFALGTGSTCTGAVTAGACAVDVTFTPQFAGLRTGSVMVTVAGECTFAPCNLPHATTLISGIGVAPQVAFAPSAQIHINSGGIIPWGIAVDAAGDVFIADTGNNRAVELPAGGGAQITVAGNLSDPVALGWTQRAMCS